MTKKKQKREPPAIPQPLATAVVASYVMRDLVRLRRAQPDAMSESDAERMHEMLGRKIRRALEDHLFDDIRDDLNPEVELADGAADLKLTSLCFALLDVWSDHQLEQTGSESREEELKRAYAECQWVADLPLTNAIGRLSEAKSRSRIDPEVELSFWDRRRSLQDLQTHWGLCRPIVLHLAASQDGLRPNPLLRHIRVLRNRIDCFFAHVKHLEGAEEAAAIAETLLRVVLDGDIDELSRVPEWTRHQVRMVDDFLERARREGGSKTFRLMMSDDRFFSRARVDIDAYLKSVDAALAEARRSAEKQKAKAQARSETGKPRQVADPEGWYTPARLAELYGVNKDALRKRLTRYQDQNEIGWKENEGRRPREPKYLYRLKDVEHIIEALRASSERPAK